MRRNRFFPSPFEKCLTIFEEMEGLSLVDTEGLSLVDISFAAKDWPCLPLRLAMAGLGGQYHTKYSPF